MPAASRVRTAFREPAVFRVRASLRVCAASREPAVSIGLARVTISAPQRRVDVALPEHVPLAELLPEVLRHAGEGLADDGEKHGGWVLRRTDGLPLATAQGL